MAKKSKKFCIATEGATVDGRVIERTWIEQMARNYDPAIYQAGINVEHIRSALPDSPFKNYGLVDSLEASPNGQGRLSLFATISPSDDLVKLTRGMQKLFTSIEVDPSFADTNEAYMVGLGVTDTPASLGTEMLQFTATNPQASPLTTRKQKPTNHFSAAVETSIQFEDVSETPSLFQRVKELFAKSNRTTEARFNDLESAIEEIAEHGATQSTRTAEQLQRVEADSQASRTEVAALSLRLTQVETQFNATAAPGATRPLGITASDALTEF